MSDFETMAATVQGQHDALMVAQGLPTYDRLKRERDELQTAFEDAITQAEKAESERDTLADALQEMLDHVEWRRRSENETAGPKDCTHRARAALAQVRK